MVPDGWMDKRGRQAETLWIQSEELESNSVLIQIRFPPKLVIIMLMSLHLKIFSKYLPWASCMFSCTTLPSYFHNTPGVPQIHNKEETRTETFNQNY